MALPPWTPNGVLPPGRYPADLADLYERFVCDAPFRDERELLFSSLAGYLGVVSRVIPSGSAWISGGLTDRTPHPPRDVDVLLLPAEWGDLKKLAGRAQADLCGLLTLRDVIVGNPVLYLEQVRPAAGSVDGFLCHPGDEDIWHESWSTARGSGLDKGYVEVVW